MSRKFDRAAALIEMVDELLQEIDDAAAGGARPDLTRQGPATPSTAEVLPATRTRPST